MTQSQRAGLIWLVLAIAGYSCLPVFTKFLFERHLDPITIGFYRFFFTFIIYWSIVLFRAARSRQENSASGSPLPRFRLIALGTLFAGEAVAAFFGLERLPAATFSVLFYTYPAMVAILEAVMGERLSRLAWGALAATLVGIALTAPDFSAGLSGGNLPGVLLALADGFMVAIYFLISSRLMRDHHDMILTSALTVSGAFGVMLISGALLGIQLPQGDSWPLLVALALICTVMPVFGLNAGIRALGSTRSAILATFEPVLTALLALIFLGELLQPIQWLGGLIIIASVILLQLRRPVSDNAEQTALARE